ncbi:P-loop NTPase fold protein [Azospira inquinata]|uniref:KAP P-loop protein n=1 Tax=Azospira inquinata TaxID=2785627 RepID=A0A975SLD2_9RHOO|nr:P-loop NTPase fold protein [Azospira inquinata]QWT46200.1 hypothetical protein J8L76_00380 [Azospira inquinata]QWT48471.1 KAP P-loop protein [Azospira inquinata]
MMTEKPMMKMPELTIFAKYLVIGFLIAEVGRIGFILGTSYAPELLGSPSWAIACGILVVAALCLTYAVKRGVLRAIAKMGRGVRVDLLFMIGIGFWVSQLAAPLLYEIHINFERLGRSWTPAIFVSLCSIIFLPLSQALISKRKNSPSQLNFLSDNEIRDKDEDFLSIDSQAETFAAAVLSSKAQTGLVFGVDGPWGVGKTSFINLAECYWKNRPEEVIVCRFEPLQYASDPDLAIRMIQDFTSAIEAEVFAPEFRTTISRYSRSLKGKVSFSFFGFKLLLEPSENKLDGLLGDVDSVLKRLGRRLIVVIDDLDRLDGNAINNVLFATKRTFQLSQVIYILCYDTEKLNKSNNEGAGTREFLEKFITAKLSLFINSADLVNFLNDSCSEKENWLDSIQSKMPVRLAGVLNELAKLLDGDKAAEYMPIVGDFRKIKRFVNAMLLMQIDQVDFGEVDFNKTDLINLILLHLNYPGVFRRIYIEETGGRDGVFSLALECLPNKTERKNSEEYDSFLKDLESKKMPAAIFLLRQLFDQSVPKTNQSDRIDEAELSSRACFNSGDHRNLEAYLEFIVRCVKPDPLETFVFYSNAVEKVRGGALVKSILESRDFKAEKCFNIHEKFWQILLDKSRYFTREVAEDAINTLVDYLPRYPVAEKEARVSFHSLRELSVFFLYNLLDTAGWGRNSRQRVDNRSRNVMEIAWRIFGEGEYAGKGIIQYLIDDDRGILGWNDLLIFRLICSWDRQGSLFNIARALIVNQNEDAKTEGPVRELAILEMRKISQKIFCLFKDRYINGGRNFFEEVDEALDGQFLGKNEGNVSVDSELKKYIEATRSRIKVFVVYQLSNSLFPQGSGVGCGYYDECGEKDEHGIAQLMNKYIFDFCFNPTVQEKNIFYFLDYCLSNLSIEPFAENEDDKVFASTADLARALDVKKLGEYWGQYGELIRQRILDCNDRVVVTSNYSAPYGKYLEKVFRALDGLLKES